MAANYTYVHQHKDYPLIRRNLQQYVLGLTEGARAKGWAAGSVDRLLHYAEDAADGVGDFQAVVLADTHILMFQLSDVWWLDGDAIVEYAFFRYKEGGNTDHVYLAMEQLARNYGAKQIVIASSASVSDKAYARLLCSQGFVQGSIQFVKEIT